MKKIIVLILFLFALLTTQGQNGVSMRVGYTLKDLKEEVETLTPVGTTGTNYMQEVPGVMIIYGVKEDICVEQLYVYNKSKFGEVLKLILEDKNFIKLNDLTYIRVIDNVPMQYSLEVDDDLFYILVTFV